jgi:hypothetical protein
VNTNSVVAVVEAHGEIHLELNLIVNTNSVVVVVEAHGEIHLELSLPIGYLCNGKNYVLLSSDCIFNEKIKVFS